MDPIFHGNASATSQAWVFERARAIKIEMTTVHFYFKKCRARPIKQVAGEVATEGQQI